MIDSLLYSLLTENMHKHTKTCCGVNVGIGVRVYIWRELKVTVNLAVEHHRETEVREVMNQNKCERKGGGDYSVALNSPSVAI